MKLALPFDHTVFGLVSGVNGTTYAAVSRIKTATFVEAITYQVSRFPNANGEHDCESGNYMLTVEEARKDLIRRAGWKVD